MAKENNSGENKSGLFSSIGSLVGFLAGGPGGAAVGAAAGNVLGGGSAQDAFQSGIGALFTGATMGAPGLFGSMVGGGDSPQERGAGITSLFGGGGGNQGGVNQFAQMALGSLVGGNSVGSALGNAALGSAANPLAPRTQGEALRVPGNSNMSGIESILQGIGINDSDGRTNPIMGGIMRELLNQQQRPRFENLMSSNELAQYNAGERRPDYRGTAVPGTPRVQTRAEGGMIDGPGSGTSDSIPAKIYQNGGPVQEARLSDGEFVMTADAVRGAGGGNRGAGAAKMYEMMNQFERRA
tara:strand:- start:2241 stop:3131 length:891 start_codon:yes stop_codon:yes gene_type:complete